jgi:hypothetical protein
MDHLISNGVNTLIPINKTVVLGHEIKKMSGFLFYGGIDIFTVECLVNSADGPLKTFILLLSHKSRISEFMPHLVNDISGFIIGEFVFCLLCAFGHGKFLMIEVVKNI